MRAALSFTLPMPPSANNYWRYGPRGEVYLTKEAKEYKATVEEQCAAKGIIPVFGAYEMHVEFRGLRGDLGNRLKVLEDALEMLAFMNDRDADDIHLERDHRELLPSEEPHCAIEISAARFATHDEVVAERVRRADANQRRRATKRKNRLNKQAAALLATPATYRPRGGDA